MAAKKGRVSRTATIEAWGVLVLILCTWWLLTTGKLEHLLEVSSEMKLLAALIAGLLYSVFVTVPLAVGAFLSLAHTLPAWQIALWGGLGSGAMDLLLAEGVRSPLMNSILTAVFGERNMNILSKRSPRGFMRYLYALFGAFLIAIPLPTDEEGVAFMGASNLRTWQLWVLTFAADFIGIYLLVSAVNAL